MLFTQSIGFILDNLADVIEGGYAYRGDSHTARTYHGIPGTLSNDAGILSGDDDAITASSTVDTTTVAYASGDWPSSRWEKSDSPQFYLVCTSAAQAANINTRRRITAWNNTTKRFTVPAFSGTVTSGDVFTVAQGFKRVADNYDINSDDAGVPGGFDRFFDLRATPGSREPWYGNNTETYKTRLELYLRIEKHSRHRRAIASAFENAMILRSGITRQTHADGTYTVLLDAEGTEPDIVTDDAKKIVVRDRFALTYRVNATLGTNTYVDAS